MVDSVATPGGDPGDLFTQDVSLVGQLGLVHAKDGITLRGVEAEPAVLNVIAFQAALHVTKLLMRGRGPRIITVTIAALQEAQLHSEGFSFTHQTRIGVAIFSRIFLC